MSALNNLRKKMNFSNSERGWTSFWKGEKLSLSLRQNLQKTQGKGWKCHGVIVEIHRVRVRF